MRIVEVDQRGRLVQVDLQATLDRLCVVIRAVHQRAAAPITDTFLCRRTKIDIVDRTTVGAAAPTAQALHQRLVRGLEEDDAYVDASGNINYRGEDGQYFDFYGQDLGLDSRALEMRGGKRGRYELRADYSEIPRFLGYGTETPYSGVGTDTLTLPVDWSFENGQFVGIENALRPTALESKRETAGAGASIRLGKSWKIEADFERQEKDGVRAFGGGTFAISAAAFPAPVDYSTDLFNMGLEFTGNRSQVRLDFSGSGASSRRPLHSA